MEKDNVQQDFKSVPQNVPQQEENNIIKFTTPRKNKGELGANNNWTQLSMKSFIRKGLFTDDATYMDED